MKDYVSPQDGGCWFCYTDKGEMFFDTEFDTFVHEECIRERLKEFPTNPEAEIMSYLISDK